LAAELQNLDRFLETLSHGGLVGARVVVALILNRIASCVVGPDIVVLELFGGILACDF